MLAGVGVLGQYPPGQYPPGQYPSSKTCVSIKKKKNSSVLNYPKTCVRKNIFFKLKKIPVFELS